MTSATARNGRALRIGLLGAGFMSSTHAAIWHRLGVEEVVAYVPDAAERDAFAAATGVTPAASLDELVARVDVVDVCTPTFLHAEGVLAAAAAGRHVICEKPLARTVSEGRRMLDACDAAGVRLFPAHVVRYFPEYAAARSAVADGRIGRPAVLRLRRGSARPGWSAGHWLFDEARSGGVILDLMVHDIDIARWMAGDVTSVMARHVRDASGADVHFAVCVLTHASGAISHVTGTWAYPPPTFRTGFDIAGDGGSLVYESVDSQPITRYLFADDATGAAPVARPSSPTDDDPYELQLADFLHAIRTGADARVTADDGLAAVSIAVAAIESSRTGRPVAPETLR